VSSGDAAGSGVVFNTQRLRVRRLRLGDAEFIVELLNDEAFLHFIGDRGVRTPEDACRYLVEGPLASYARYGYGLFMVEHRDDGVPIGICGLLLRPSLEAPDIGFAYLAPFRGQGYGLEAAEATLRYAREELGIERVVAVTQADNVASVALLRRLGLEREGTTRIDDDAPEIELYAIRFDDVEGGDP